MTGANEKASLFLIPTADTESPSPTPALLRSTPVSKTLRRPLTPVPALIYLPPQPWSETLGRQACFKRHRSFNKSLLSTYCVPSTVLVAGNTTMNKTDKDLCPHVACILVVGGGRGMKTDQRGSKFRAILSKMAATGHTHMLSIGNVATSN